jgi:hypothetical protein
MSDAGYAAAPRNANARPGRQCSNLNLEAMKPGKLKLGATPPFLASWLPN